MALHCSTESEEILEEIAHIERIVVLQDVAIMAAGTESRDRSVVQREALHRPGLGRRPLGDIQ